MTEVNSPLPPFIFSSLWLNQAHNFPKVAGLILLLSVAEAKAKLFDVSNDGGDKQQTNKQTNIH
jgi:hypothetical protein